MDPQRIETNSRVISLNDKKNYLILKRTLDIFGAIAGLLILSPIFLLVAILIKLEDPKGPIFFKQTRVGQSEQEFTLYKFRSMVVNAEALLDELMNKNETTGALFKMKNDPRVSRVGRIIRKTSIDELPQLWNILKGEMSLVGPRPPLPREVKLYSHYDKQRLVVVPGLTGLWQVSGRSEIGFHEMVELDLHYIKNRNILFDIKIILLTFKCFLGSDNAY